MIGGTSVGSLPGHGFDCGKIAGVEFLPLKSVQSCDHVSRTYDIGWCSVLLIV